MSSSPAGINCGSTCSAQFADGAQVTLTATAAAGSTFTGWLVDGSSTTCPGTGTCTVTMSANHTVTAAFAVVLPTLTVQKFGTGSGTVTSSPSGIDCGPTCSASFPSGQKVTLTVQPAPGSTFSIWGGSGTGCSTSPTCTVTIGAATSVTATFALVVSPTLSIQKFGTGSGTVTSSPSGIDCGSTCSATFPSDQKVTLTEQPASGSTFSIWGGSGTGCFVNPTCTVTISGATSVTATFARQTASTYVTATIPLLGAPIVTQSKPGGKVVSTIPIPSTASSVIGKITVAGRATHGALAAAVRLLGKATKRHVKPGILTLKIGPANRRLLAKLKAALRAAHKHELPATLTIAVRLANGKAVRVVQHIKLRL